MRTTFRSLVVVLMLMPISAWSQSYDYYCEQTFPVQTYPGLNEFCLYLVSSGPLWNESQGLPGYSNLFMKEGYGIFHDYSLPGYPTIDFMQLMDNHATTLKLEHDSNSIAQFDQAMRRLIWDFHDIHIKYNYQGGGIGFDAELALPPQPGPGRELVLTALTRPPFLGHLHVKKLGLLSRC